MAASHASAEEWDWKPVCLARQPIFDRSRQVIGYELLQRVAAGETWHPDDSVVTRQVIRKAILDFGLDQLVGSKDVYLNVPAECLALGEYEAFPADRTVLEVLERVVVTDQLITDVRRAKDLGYRIALDDYAGDRRFDPLLPMADVVKIDLEQCDTGAVEQVLCHLAKLAPKARILAEKVETESVLVELLAQPVSLFQGYYFRRPILMETQPTPSADQVTLLKISAALQEPDIGLGQLAGIVSSDPRLAFQLIKVVNSAAFSMPRSIQSIHEAAVILGMDQIRRIVYLLTLAAHNRGPDELIALALIRARMCENLARLKQGNGTAAFTVGLFSLLDVALGQPVESVVTQLSLASDVCDALVSRTGPLFDHLQTAISFEDDCALDERPPTPEAADLYLESIAWAEKLRSEIDHLAHPANAEAS
jgi:EAL and modified HD-GYP domain-containing signal transduction protein